MQSIPQRKKPITPWYREPWPWLLMSGPATVIVAGIYTTVLAFSGTDGLVADDYYKQGLAMNKTLGRGLRAQQLDLAARVNYTAASGQVRVVLTGAQHPPALLLRLTHPTRVGMDQRIELKHLENGVYEAAVNLPTGVNRWNAVLETPEWRLAGTWGDPVRAELALAPARS